MSNNKVHTFDNYQAFLDFSIANWGIGKTIRYTGPKDDLIEAICNHIGCNGYSINIDKALHHYKKSAELGSTYAMNNIGCIYIMNKKDIPTSMEWHLKAAQLNDKYAINNLAVTYLELDDKKSALEWFDKLKDSDYAPALYNLGSIYQKDEYKDLNKSIGFYIKAANLGNVSAMFNLGCIYDKLYNNIEESIKWYKRAIEKGCFRSLNNLGYLYEFKLLDAPKAQELYIEAFKNYGINCLHLIDNYGDGIELDGYIMTLF